jgi:hypothetical protein
MNLNEFVDERMAAALNRALHGVTFEPIVKTDSLHERSVTVVLPAAPKAEYQFVLYIKPERQIHARLLQQVQQQNRNYFWYRPFEYVSDNFVEKHDAAFIETIEKLVRNETRIVQKRGLLNHSFRLDYKSPSGWKRVYGHWALRLGGFSVPSITGRRRVYHSPALLHRG